MLNSEIITSGARPGTYRTCHSGRVSFSDSLRSRIIRSINKRLLQPMIPLATLPDPLTTTRRTQLAWRIAAGLAIVGWCALAGELHFILGNRRPFRIVHSVVEFFSFFTVISNLLVAIILTLWALRPVDRFTGQRATRVTAAAVVYILMTGLVYTLLLRQSHGSIAGWVVDIALHQSVPLGYCWFWVVILPKHRLDGSDAVRWLILPLAFALVALVRGAITGEYTYPFLNPARLGYPRVALNVVLLSLPFFGLGMVVMKVSRVLQRRAVA